MSRSDEVFQTDWFAKTSTAPNFKAEIYSIGVVYKGCFPLVNKSTMHVDY
jgi:hypothetical protein